MNIKAHHSERDDKDAGEVNAQAQLNRDAAMLWTGGRTATPDALLRALKLSLICHCPPEQRIVAYRAWHGRKMSDVARLCGMTEQRAKELFDSLVCRLEKAEKLALAEGEIQEWRTRGKEDSAITVQAADAAKD